MVAGINPKLPYSYYLDIVRAVKDVRPDVAVKAFTAIEWVQIARIAKSTKGCHDRIKSGCVSSIPAGAQKYLAIAYRKIYSGPKPDSEEWLEVARTAHEVGLPTNATMLYGHIENPKERIRSSRAIARITRRDQRFFDVYSPVIPSRTHRIRASIRGQQASLI